MRKYTAFVPNGESRHETAVLLVGTADEFGIDQRSILPAAGGFHITEEMAEALGAEPVPDEPTEEPVGSDIEAALQESAPKPSGRRTAKNDS